MMWQQNVFRRDRAATTTLAVFAVSHLLQAGAHKLGCCLIKGHGRLQPCGRDIISDGLYLCLRTTC